MHTHAQAHTETQQKRTPTLIARYSAGKEHDWLRELKAQM